MKNLFKRLPKKLIASVTIFVVTLISMTAVGMALLGGDRPVKQYQGPGTPGFDNVTFNSFTDVPNIGDERNFFHGKIAGAPNGFYDPMNGVRSGDEILMRVYVHNNADPKHNASGKGVAKNTKVRVELPSTLNKSQVAKAFVSADNAQPKVIEDTLSISGEYPVQLDYVPGSATIKTNFIDKKVSDNIVSDGVLIGDDNTNGTMKGCFEYVALVTFKVKVKSPRYTINKQVSMYGQQSTAWQKSIDVKPGDYVSWMITFKNTGATELKNVKVVDEVPTGVEVVPGTAKLINGNYPNGYVYPNSAIQANGRQVNVDIGNYNPEGIAYFGFRTKVSEGAKDECGVKEITNKAFTTPTGFGAIWETAKIRVNYGECKTDEPVYSCDLVTLKQLGGRKVEANVSATAINGAKIKNYVYDFGDGSDKLVTDKTSAQYTYAKDGKYNVSVAVNVNANGKDQLVESDKCSAPIEFKSGKPVTPVTPTKPTTTELPNTGAGDVAGLVAAVTVAGAVAHRAVNARRNG
jgi:uncharacterized repeat protein (TIGR01451 family)